MRLKALNKSCFVAVPLQVFNAFEISSFVTVIGRRNMEKDSLKNPPNYSPSSVSDLLKSYFEKSIETTSRAFP
jgi:hypothetical protein